MSMENRCINNRSCTVQKTRHELDIAITKVSFAMDDTRLFLDTHIVAIDCAKAFCVFFYQFMTNELEFFKVFHSFHTIWMGVKE